MNYILIKFGQFENHQQLLILKQINFWRHGLTNCFWPTLTTKGILPQCDQGTNFVDEAMFKDLNETLILIPLKMNI